MQTGVQDLPASSSVPQSDIDNNLDDPHLCNVRASKRNNGLDKNIMEHLSTSVFIPPDPICQENFQPTQKQHKPIITNRSSTSSEEKQSLGEQRIDEPMSPLSPCTETSSQNASPARSPIDLQVDSITVSRTHHLMFY